MTCTLVFARYINFQSENAHSLWDSTYLIKKIVKVEKKNFSTELCTFMHYKSVSFLLESQARVSSLNSSYYLGCVGEEFVASVQSILC